MSVASAQLEHIAEPSGGDQPDPRASALYEGVDRRGGAVEEAGDVRRVAGKLAETGDDLLWQRIGRGGLLLDRDLARRPIDHDQVDEGPADIDRDDGAPLWIASRNVASDDQGRSGPGASTSRSLAANASGSPA